MALAWLDWLVVFAYVAFALWVGVRFTGRASEGVNEFFLSGRRLPWWMAGTSMVATTFAADTPLVITGWVRDYGVWKNWQWWCFAVCGFFTAFLFARMWRRAEIMTTAELAELRYGEKSARVLRGFLGTYHTLITNVITLAWVLLAAGKISEVLIDVPKEWAIGACCAVTLTYSLLSGLWGVVLTDVTQFGMAMFGAIALAVIVWTHTGGAAPVLDAVASGVIPAERLAFIPPTGPGSPFDASFWTAPVVAFAVYIGIQWWAYEAVDGGGYVVQRISACKDERHGVLAQIWFQVAHNALRPWCWIVVALASLLVMPTAEHRTPVAGTIARAELGRIEVAPTSGAPNAVVAWDAQAPNPPLLAVKLGDAVGAGQIVARTDSERAYPEMMARYLPVGLLGLVVASLLAALMSTIDTHVNLASSFFVNDVYRRFLAKDRSDRHYVTAARLSGLGVMALAGIVASQADSIRGLFTFFLAFMGGVGAVYVLRWTWWRVRATTEIAAMLTSSLTTVVLTHADIEWRLGPFADHGALTDEGRLVLVVLASTIAAVLVTIFGKAPDPAKLVAFYRKVRPLGFLGPSRRARARRRAAARGALRATRRGRRTRGDVRARVHDRRSLVRQRGGNLDQRDRRDHGHRRGGHRSARDHSRRGTRMTRGQ
jgi:SSS family solute:Na+ symporter